MRISDWSSDVCSSDLLGLLLGDRAPAGAGCRGGRIHGSEVARNPSAVNAPRAAQWPTAKGASASRSGTTPRPGSPLRVARPSVTVRSEEHTSELQSLMRISYAVFCLKKKKILRTKHTAQKN